MVVIAIIVILAALLLPVMASAKEKGKRATCKNNLRQAIITVHLYANDYLDHVPDGRDNDDQWHAIRIRSTTYTNMIQYTGNLKILDCPNFTYGSFDRYDAEYGFLIGYAYLGNANMTDWPLTSAFTGIPRKSWWSPARIISLPTPTLGVAGGDGAAPADGWPCDPQATPPHADNVNRPTKPEALGGLREYWSFKP